MIHKALFFNSRCVRTQNIFHIVKILHTSQIFSIALMEPFQNKVKYKDKKDG